MKKIIFACCAVCFLTGVAFGGNKKCGVDCNDTNKGKHLLCSESGNPDTWLYLCADGSWDEANNVVVSWCKADLELPDSNYISYGNWNSVEGSRWYVKKNLQKNGTGYFVDGPDISDNTNFCLACQQGYKYDENAGKCVNEKKAVIEPECKPGDPDCNQNPRMAQLAHPCPEGKTEYDECLTGNSKAPSNATKARCVYLQGKPGEAYQLTCAATECKDGYLLWLNAKGNSQGICHSEKHAKNVCSKGCNNCKPNEKCVPWIVDTPSNLKINGQTLVPKKNGAYKECHCEPDAGVVTGSDISCKYVFSVYCDDGQDVTYVLDEFGFGQQVDLTPESLRNGYKGVTFDETEIATCTGGDALDKNNPVFRKMYNRDIELLNGNEEAKKAIIEACKSYGGYSGNSQITGGSASGSVGIIYSSAEQADHSAEIAKAQQTIDAFFANAKDNRSVWKNAEGKFNTARLASDITAGVVLGTVGGVVSGIIIKKNQVKKGFEALHCAVGGQTVADWGDEFSVGLR